jgi:hypothetical protein
MMTEDQLTFRLHYFCRFDEGVEAFVGYIPSLQVYAQSPSEDGLKAAVHASAKRFILACADTQVLTEIMRECGMHKVGTAEELVLKQSEEAEFVSVRGYKECSDPIEVSVPLSVIAAQHATA